MKGKKDGQLYNVITAWKLFIDVFSFDAR